jgi:zinc protease
MFQLVYLTFTAPRTDSSAFAAYQNQVGSFLANKDANPNSVFSDTISVTMAQKHHRARPLTVETFKEVDLQKAMAFYRSRFADASDFTFVFVGSFDVDSMKPLVERYLGGLPSTGRKETWKDIGVTPPKGVIEKTVRKGVEPKATTLMLFTGTIEPTRQERFALSMMGELLQIKLREQLREQLGGTYTVGVGASASRVPRPEYTVQVSYQSAPDRVGQLGKAVFEQIESLKTAGPSEADVAKIKEAQIRSRETNLKLNAYWLGQLASRAEADEPLSDILTYEQMVNALTPKMIQDAARKYLNTENYARFILLPENAPSKM